VTIIISDAYIWTPGDAMWDVGVLQISDWGAVQEQQKYQADVRAK
jgi:3D-(3,5/4)-trihydroxycyclohexane-1,2-dione acylhydrolase (decyclizing)